MEKKRKMKDLEEVQILAQLVDNMEIVSNELEKSFKKKNSEKLNNSKKEIKDISQKINKILKNEL